MRVKRIISAMLTAAMTASCIPVNVFAEAEPEYIPETEIDSAYIDDGMFYLASAGAEIEENAGHGYLLKIARSGSGDEEQSVRLTMTDMTASCGKDYKVKLYNKALFEGRIENTGISQSMLDFIENNDSELYNYSDAVIDGTVTAENQLTEEEEKNSEITDEEKQKIQDSTNEFMNSIITESNEDNNSSADNNTTEENQEETVTDGSFTLARAKENATGLENDKQPLSFNGGTDNSSAGYMSDSIEEVNKELSSAYMTIKFDAGETEKYIEITPIDNNESDGTRQTGFDLSAESEGAAVSGMYSNFTLKVIDDEEYVPAELSFTETEYHPEDGYITATIQRTGCMTSNLYAMVDTEDDTAIKGRDYSQVHAKVVFGFGVKEQKIKIPVNSDNINEESRFKLKLQEPVECTIGSNSEAYGVIDPSDKSFEVKNTSDESEEAELADISLGSVETGPSLNLKNIAYGARISDNKGYNNAYENDGWEMCLKTLTDSATASVNFDVGKHYDYSGYQIDWERKSAKNNYGHTHFGQHFDKIKWESELLYESEKDPDYERWNRRIDNYYISSKSTENLFFEMRKRAWSSDPTLRIYSIKPILRPFKVDLYGSDSVPVIDENGNIEETKDDEVMLLNSSDNSVVTNSTSSVTLTLRDKKNSKCYISGIKIVDLNSGKETFVKNNLPEGTTSESVSITNDFIKNYLDYIKFEKNGSNGLNGHFALKAVLSNMPATVKVKNDDRVNVTLWDGNGGVKHGIKQGEFTVYNYNVGDFVRYSIDVKDGESSYTWNNIRIDTVRSSGIQPYMIFRKEGSNYAQERIKSSEIEVSPVLTERKNELVVRIKKDELALFNRRQGVPAYSRVENGDYYEYKIDTDSANIPGKEYELTAAVSDKSYIPIWSTASNREVTYSQNTFYYTGLTEPGDNVLYLTAKKADDIPYSIAGQMYYDDAALGSTVSASAWYSAYGVYYIVDKAHYGITDMDGKIKTYPVKAAEGSYIKYKVVSSGITTYKTVKAEKANLQSETFDTADGNTYTSKYYLLDTNNQTISSSSIKRPHIKSVTVKDMNGASSGEISINNEITTITANVECIDPDTGKEYQYSYQDNGKTYERKEAPKAVDFVVYDQVTHREKAVIEGAKSEDGGKTWSVSKSFETGKYSEYKAGDILYAKLTTDRYIGNGCTEDEDGNITEVDALKETHYAPVRTTVTFSEINPKQTEEIDINFDTPGTYKLPIIGSLETMINVCGMSFGIMATENNGIRLYFGKQIKSMTKGNVYDGNGNKVSDTGFIIDKSNFMDGFSEMKDMINNFGSENKVGAMSLGVPVWSFEPIVGVYFEFSIYHDAKMAVANRLEFAGAGGYMGALGKFRYTYYMVVYGVPVYVGGDFNLTALGEFGIQPDENAHIAYNDPTQDFFNEIIDNSHFQFVFRAILDVNAYAGVGVCGTVGIRGGFNLHIRFIATPAIRKTYPSVREVGFTVGGAIKFWADAVLLSIPIPVYSWEELKLGYFEDIEKLNGDNEVSLLSDINSEIVSKPRNQEQSRFTANDSAELQSTFENISSKNIIENSYDDAQQKLISMDDGKMLMVYLDDDKSRDDNNRTALKYSIYFDGIWSNPETVQNDGTADFAPAVCDAGDDIILTWVSRPENTELSTYRDYLSKTEIYTVRINKKTGEFGEIERLTNDDYYDTNPNPVYNSKTGDVLVFYSKSYVGEVDDADDLLNAVTPDLNNSEIAYMLYDGASGEWVRDRFYDNEVAEGADTDKLLKEFDGQRFLSAPIEDFGMNNPVISDVKAKTGYIFNSTVEELIQYMKDNGYDVEGEIKEEDEEEIMLLMLAFVLVHCKEYAVLSYTVDADKNLSTDADREIFVQLYDFENHKTEKPIRVTNNNVNDSSPQLVNAAGNVYLFWLSDGKEVEYSNLSTEFYNGSGEINSHKVEISGVNDKEGTSISDFKAFVDADGSMFIAWQENSADELDSEHIKQDIYVAGYIDEKNDDGEEIGAWSDAIRMTDNGKLNELPEFADTGSGLMMVNTQYDFNISEDMYNISNVNLVETNYALKGSIVVTDVNSDDTPKNAEDEFNVDITLKNTGIKAETGVTYSCALMYGGKVCSESIGKIDGELRPGEEYKFTEVFTVPEQAEGNLQDLSLKVIANSDGTENVLSEHSVFDGQPEYKLSDIKALQNGDYFDITGTVTNIGSAAAAASDEILITENGNYDNVLARTAVGELAIGESKPFAATVKANNELAKYGYINCMLLAKSADNKTLSEFEAVQGYVVNAFDLGINGDTELNEITVKQGESIKLESSYAPDNYFRNADAVYAIDDTDIAKVENGVLYGLEAGETDMNMTIDLYGGSKKIKVKVEGTNPTPSPTEKPTPKPSSGSSGGSGGGGHSVGVIAPAAETPQPTAKSEYEKFSDVLSSDWFSTAVNSMADMGIVNGMSETAFEPQTNITRAMFASMLYRYAGLPETEGDVTFTDIDESAYYASAVKWAALQGIVTGYDENTFAPNDTITREQAAAMLYRYAKSIGADTSVGEDTNILSYDDYGNISEYAIPAICWTVGSGIMKGRTDSTVNPVDTVTRAETAQIIYNYIQYYKAD